MRLEGFWDSRFVATALAIAGAWLVTPAAAPLDDAYIILHSADAVLAGRDAVYNSPALTGVTSPAYLALIVALKIVGFHGTTALYAASALGVIACLYGTWSLAAVSGVHGLRRVVLPALTVCTAPIAITLTNGLETGWATACIIWSLVFMYRDQRYASAVLAGLLPCLRPELAPIAAVLCLAAAWPLRWSSLRPIALAALVCLPFVLWIRFDTGLWWPQTMVAKRVFFAEDCPPLVQRVGTVTQLLVGWLWATLPLAIGLVALVTSPIGRVALVTATLVLGIYSWTLPGAVGHNHLRYVTPLLVPWALFGLAKVMRVSARVGDVASIAAICLTGLIGLPDRHRRDAFAHELRDVAEWVQAHTPDGATVLVHDAGAMSVFAGRPLVDLVGLKTPSSVEAHRTLTWPSCGERRGEAIDVIARMSGARFFVVVEGWNRLYRLTDALTQRGWQLSLVRGHPRGAWGYDVYRLQSAPPPRAVDEQPARLSTLPRPAVTPST